MPEVPSMVLKASLLALGALMLAPAIASAVPEKEPHGSVAGLVGYGFDADGSEGIYGLFGFGVRGGYTLRQNIYIGGTFMDHFAEREVLYLLGVEGGYDFQLEPVMIRPYIGLGFAHDTFSFESSTREYSDTFFAFSFGGTVLFNLNEQWFIGGDFKLPIFISRFGAAFFPTPCFTGGLNF
jgi:hypothetical protein